VPGYGNPQNLNRYSYVTNNPLRYTDPTGHMRVDDEFGGGDIYTPPISNNNDDSNHDDDEDENGGGDKVLPSPQPNGPIPPELLQWVSNIRWIWRSGPDWLFRVEQGRRILMVNHPHQGVPFWHINSDLRLLPHAVNIEPALKTIATISAGIQTATTTVKAAGTAFANSAFATFAGGTESFIPLIIPRPDMFIPPLPGQTAVYN
jgi:hypothetical protein